MFILKTSPQQSYCFQGRNQFCPFLDLPFVFHKNIYRLGNHFCNHTGGINIILCLLFYVQKNKVTSSHLNYLT